MNKLNEDYVLQLFVIALSDKNLLELLQNHLKVEYMPDESYQDLWKAIITEFNLSEIRKPPSIPVLKQKFRKDNDVLELLSEMKEMNALDKDSTMRNLEIYIRQNMFVDYYNRIGNLYNKGNKESAYLEFQKRATDFVNFSLSNQMHETVFGDFNKRKFDREVGLLTNNERVRIPFGIDELDYYIKGAESGEFVLIMGDSGSGKSFLGNALGINAARRGFCVYHAQGEGTKEQVLNRYDSAFTGTRYYDVKNNEFGDDRKRRSIDKVIDNIKGEVFVRAFEMFNSASINDIRNDIVELKKKHDIKYVIVDYLDLFDPGDGKRYDANIERFRQQNTSRALKNLAVEQNVVVISFTQASSISPENLNDPNFVITRFNIAEDKGKIRPTDLFITINRTKEEREQNICRLYIDKAREHAGGQIIYIYQSLAYSRFYDKKKTLREFFTEEEDE